MYSAIDNIHFHFLYIDRYSFGRNWIFPESSIPYNMLRYIESGTASFFIDSISPKEVSSPALPPAAIFPSPVFVLPALFSLKEGTYWGIIIICRRLWRAREKAFILMKSING